MIVLDSSAAVHMARKTAIGNGFRSLQQPEETILAPTLYQAEIVNALWKYVRAGIIPEEPAWGMARDALAFVDTFCGMESLQDEVFHEAVRLDHSVYDLYYLVLARRHTATLFSNDKKMCALADQMGVNHIELIEF